MLAMPTETLTVPLTVTEPKSAGIAEAVLNQQIAMFELAILRGEGQGRATLQTIAGKRTRCGGDNQLHTNLSPPVDFMFDLTTPAAWRCSPQSDVPRLW